MTADRQRTPDRQFLLVEELEPRILYSADAAALLNLAGPADPSNFRIYEHQTTSGHAEPVQSRSSSPAASAPTEIIFIDSGVPDAFELADALMQQRGNGRLFDIAILDANEDGITQINRVLAGERNLAAIHIISHGSDGALAIGNSVVDNERLVVDAAAVARWGQSLAPGGDLLLYGCDVAQSATGQSFVQNLARLTGADVAASSNLTGNAAQGGDWTLEYAVGQIETGIAAGQALQAGWIGTMAIAVAPTSSSNTANDSSWLSVSHTTAAGNDRLMLVGVTMDAESSPSVSGISYGTQTLTLVGSRAGGSNPVRVEIWSLVNPNVGTANVVINLNRSVKGVGVGVTSFTGVDQTTPLRSFVSAVGDSSSASINVVSAAGELVFDVVSGKDSSSWSAGSGQTQRWNVSNSGGEHRGAGSIEAGAATVTMSWSRGSSKEWAIGAVSIRPAVNVAPLLDASKSPALTAVNEDAAAPSGAVGTLVSQLVDFANPAGQLDNVTDPDSGALLGIAITAADNANGSWHYSINNGTNWNPLGAVADNNARLLAANARLYFQPNANYNGTLANAITFRAWDQTTGSNGTLADTTVNGGSSAFSVATDTASLVVNPVNDAPVLDNTGTMTLPNGLQDAANPAGITVAALIASAGGDRITDIDAGAVEGIAITAASSSIGSWQYSTDGGASWFAVGSVANSQARLLGATPADMIRFVSNPGASGSAAFSFRAWDRSDALPSGSANVDTTSNGGSSPFSTATQLASIYVEPLQVILWLSTSGDVAASGVPGLAGWSQSSVLAVGDPGLSFGSNSTGGRVTSITDFDNFGSDVNIVGLHRVGRAITMSGGGITGGSVSLLAGDMLFVTDAAENLSTAAVGPPAGWSSSIHAVAGGVYVYRPASAGDYSTGFFRHIVSNPGSNTTREIALVETPTLVGGTALAAGDLLFTQTGTIQQNDIHWYRTASDSSTELIDGAQVGIPGTGSGAAKIDSLDLIHGSFTAGGITFQAGDLLVGFDKQVTGVGGGASTLVAMPQDIVRMRFTATTHGSGTAVATAAMVFDGDGNAKFDTAAENVDAISLLIRSAGGNLPPAVTLPGPALSYTEGSGAVLIDASATVSDLDSTDMDTGVLLADFSGNGTSNDRLGIRHQGTAPTQIGVAGSSVTYGGVLIGSFAGGSDGSTPLLVNLNANATPAAVQALLRNLTYTNVSNNPSTAPRTLRVLLSDGDGATSSAVTKAINVTNLNDPPVAVADAWSTNEDTPLVVAPSTAGLNNWWGFNEGGTNQTTASSGGLGSSGTRGATAGADASDPSWNAGLLGGGGLSFNGAGQYVQTTSTELQTAGAFTLSAWFQANTTTGAQHLLWQGYAGGNGYGDGGSASPATSEMSLSIGSISAAYNNKIIFSLGYDVPANGADSIFIVSASDFTDTTRWHQVAVSVADIGGGVVRASLYVDGKLEGTGTGTQNDRSAWQALRIGAAGDGSRSFNGKIDEVRVYGAELSGAQILAVMQPGVLANDSDPDSAPLQVQPTLVSGPANGTLAVHADGSFTYTPNPNFHGTDSFSYRATDGTASSNPATVTITVLPVADTPSVTHTTTNEDTQSTSGLVISRNPADGAEVTHFRITGIVSGTLYKNDGITPIANGSFITFAEGNAGLKFTPAADIFGSGGFTVQASTSNLDAGLGGNAVSAVVTINPVADTPAVSSTTTNEDTQSAGGLVISRNPADGAEVTHFKITAIGNGTLFLNDGVTPIANGSFITFAEGNAGLKFTPAPDFNGIGSFLVQASKSNGDAGLGGGTATATITVTAVNDAPTIANLADDFVAYLPGTGVIVIDQGAAAVVADIDSANFAGGNLTVRFAAGGIDAQDMLAISNQGTAAGQIGIAGADVTYGGTVIGSWSGGSGGASLVVTLNANADPTSTSALVRNITYQNNAGAGATTGLRTVRFVLSDGGAGGTSAAHDALVNIGRTVRDNFTAESYANNDGTDNWNGDWIESETGGGAGPGAGNFRQQSGSLQVTADTLGQNIYRGVNLAGASLATLSYSYDSTSFAGQAAVEIQVSGDGGSTYRALKTYDASNPGSGTDSFALLGSELTADARLRVIVTGARADSNIFRLDDVQIAYAVNAAPVLDAGKSPALGSITEDSGAPAGAVGSLVSTLIDSAGALANVSDADPGAQFGIAVTAASAANGSWFYSIDNGAAWTALGAVSDGGARLLAADAGTRIYFRPNANYHGTQAAALTFRAWDRTTGSNGGLVSTSSNGGSTAFSTATDTVSQTVLAVADTPSVSNAATNEDTQTASGLVITRNVVDGSEVTHFKITAIGNGTLFLDDGISPVAVGSFITAAQGNAGLKFTPAPDFNGTGNITVRASTSNSDAGLGGGTATATITVAAVNDAPTLGDGMLAAGREDDFAAAGQTIGVIFSGQFADIDAGSGFAGIAVVGNAANAATHGAWQYSTNGGANWFAVGPVADGATSLALSTTTRLRFVPAADYHGTPPPLVVRGLDNTYAGAYSTTAGSESRVVVDVTVRGGSSPVAAATANLSTNIDPLADTPSVTNALTSINTQSSSGLVISRNAVDGSEVSHFKITAISNGTLYKDDGVTAIADGSFISFAEGNAGLRFTPATGFTGNGGFSVQASTSGADAGLGGAVVTATIAVNSAPTISNGAVVPLVGTDEDTPSPATTVDDLLSGAGWADVDVGTSKGIAITATSGSGSWQYSTDGITWVAVGSVGASNALQLDASSRLRFQPDTLSGGPASLAFRAWDHTSGTASTNATRSLANPGAGGGSSAWSSQSASAALSVTPINDAPTLTDRALRFDGSDIVVVADHLSLVVGSQITIEATIQRSGVPGGDQIIVNKEGEYEIGIDASGRLQWAFANSAPGWSWVATSFTVPADTWVRLAVSYDGSSASVHVDGVQVDSTITSGPIGDAYPAMNDLTIGGRQNTSAQRFVGLIDEVRIWNIERSAAEIAATFDTALAGNEAGLVGYWRFSEATGTVALDSSSRGNHGVLGNGIAADMPARTGNLDYTVAEDGSLTVGAPGLLANATDPEGSPLVAILVSGPANASSFTLNADGSFIYVPNADFAGIDSFVFKAGDGALESRPVTVRLTVTPVNDAPTLADASLAAIDEDAVDPAGATLGAIFSGGFADVDDGSSFSGVAVVGNAADAATQGSWQYSTNGGGNWFAIGAVADGATALALDSATLVRFVPVANFNGAPPALLLRGLDDSRVGAWSTTAGSEVRVSIDTSSNGGSTAIAAATTALSAAVSAVADTPSVSNTSTDEDTQSTSGLVISRHAADGVEVPFFKITGISNGTLFMNDGSTVIADGDFISFADGNAGLRFTPFANFNGNGSFIVQASTSNDDAGLGGATVLATITVNAVNDAPTTAPVTLVSIAEDSGPRLITQAELLASASDIDGPALSATNLAISSGSGSLVDNGDGSWTYTPATDDDSAVSFSYTVTDGLLTAAGSATLDITPVNDAPTTSSVTLVPIAEDSGPRLITQAELLANAADVDGPALTATNLVISSGAGSLVDNGDGSWTYAPALNDDTAVNFSYTVTDGSLSAAGFATLDITPVNDAPTSAPVTLVPIAEDSGSRLITQAELLANASDIDGPALSAINLVISSGSGSLVNNGDGSWSYTPATDDDTSVTFSYLVSDGSLSAAGAATLDITPVNDAPTTTPVTLAPIAEDSGPRLITQAELLPSAADVDGPGLTAINLVISSGSGSLVDNGDGSWTYTPALHDDTAVSFGYTVTDGSLSVVGSATLDITPGNDPPTTAPVTLAPIVEDSGPRLITQAELLVHAADVEGQSLTAIDLVISSGSGSLVDNGDGSWSYTAAPDDDTSVAFSYTVTDGGLGVPGSATLDITPVNDAPTTSLVTLAPIAEDSGPRLITQAELLVNAADIDGPGLTAINLVISSGSGLLVNNGDGTWTYTPALNDDSGVSFSYAITDGSLSVAGNATLDITPVNDVPTTSLVTLAPIAEDSGPRLITQAELLANASDIDGPALTAINLVIGSGSGSLVNNGDGSWTYTPALNDDTSVSFSYTVTDGLLTATGNATLDITPVNDVPTTSLVTLAPIAEDSGPRLITQAELLANASDIDGPALTAINLVISSGSGSLVDNGDGSWTYTPALNDDTAVSFSYTVTDGSLSVAGSATLDITPVNDVPTTSLVTLAPIAEDSGPRLITQAELLANASDIDGPALTAINLVIGSGSGSLVNNGDGSWTYTPALNDDTSVSFSYTVTDGLLTATGNATLDITPVNDVPTTSLVTLAPIAEDSGPRLITQAELLANASDIDGPTLTATNLMISSGSGSLVNNGDGSWTYAPATDDDTSVNFSYLVSDGSLSAAGAATLHITPVNDVPTTAPVTLAPIAEDSGPRLITQAELLANSVDVDGPSLAAINLAISSGSGSLVDNSDGTWTYSPALNDDTSVVFGYLVTDGSLSVAGSATLDITPVNDAPTTSTVTLAPIAEDSGSRLITQAELLANAADIDGPGLTAINLAIGSGLGTLKNNGNGTWTFTPASNDDTSVSFSYLVTDGSLSAAGSATLDITPVNDAPTTSPVTLVPIAEDSGPRLITQAELLVNASDIDGPALTAINLAIGSGSGSLVDNGDGTWTYTPALNDDTAVSFSYTVTDGSLSVAGSATLDIASVNDAPTTTPVILAPIAEDSGPRLITQAELLANAADIDGPGLTAINLAIGSGLGTLTNNGNGTWTFTPASNDDTSVSFSYLVTDGSLSAAGSATLDITPVNDVPTTSLVTLAPIAEDSGPRLITQAELLVNASDIDGPALTAINLAIGSGSGSLVDNGDGTWTYTPALNDDTAVSFSYTVTDGSLSVAGSATLDIASVNDAPTTTPVILAPIAEDSGPRLITQAELLANAADIDGPGLTAINLAIGSGLGTLTNNGNGTWTFTPASNDDTSVSFSYLVTDGSLSAAGSATLDITPVNDAPTTSPVILAPIAEDSGPRLITQAELLVNAADIDGPSLTAINLAISSGLGTLTSNGGGSWTYTPASNDDTSVSFSYLVTDGSLTATGSATLDITPVNDAPTTSLVTLAAIAEDSGPRLITQAELLANASDVDGPSLTAVNLVISSGFGSLVDNGDGSWTYTPASDDDTAVSFSYFVTDGKLSMSGLAHLDITPVDDLPLASLAPIGLQGGEAIGIDARLLQAGDVDSATESIAFVVIDVQHGRFESTAAPGVAILKFSQADVIAGRIVFVSTSATDSPSFTIAPFDGNGYGDPIVASIDFRRSLLSTIRIFDENDSKVRVAAALQTVAPPYGRVGAHTGSDQEAMTLQPANDAATPAGHGLKALPTSHGQPIDDVVQEIARTTVGSASAVKGGAGMPQRASRFDNPDFYTRVAADDYVARLDDFHLIDLLQLIGNTSSGESEHFVPGPQSSDEQGGSGLKLSDAARASAVALTAGTVWWALRSGSLLTGLLVSLPSWRHADLLAVLPDEDDQDSWDRAEDTESARDEHAVDLIFDSTDEAGRR